MSVIVQQGRLLVDGQAVPLLSGEVHYWRLDRRHWRTVLKAARECGLAMVGTYVPWRVHEPVRGTFDFGAAPGSRLDLAAFLELCRELGLYVFLRPGPLIVSEMDHGGLPDWLFEDPRILTHNAHGEVARFGSFADAGNPCYLHPTYLHHARNWLHAVNRVVRPFLHTNGGPIVLVQLDNEISMLCLDSCFSSEYNPLVADPDGLYQQWLERKYGGPAKVPCAGESHVAPPRGLPEDFEAGLPRLFDWVEFKGDYLARYAEELPDIQRNDGLADEIFVVNFNPHRPIDVPNNWLKLEQATGGGISGFDYYKRPHLTWQGFQKTALSVRYSCAVTKLPWSPEWMCGTWGEDFGADGVVGPEHTEFFYIPALGGSRCASRGKRASCGI